MGTIAWFAGVQAQTKDADDFVIDNPSGILETLTIHPLISSNASAYNFSETPDATYVVDPKTRESTLNLKEGVTEFGLKRYSMLHPDQPVLFLFTFVDGTKDSDILMRIASTTDFFLGQTHDVPIDPDDPSSGTRQELIQALAKEDNPLSSVIQYQYVTFASAPSYTISSASLSSASHFANLSSDGGDFVSYQQEKIIYQGSADTTLKYVAVVFDYYAEAMEYIYTMNIGNPVFDTLDIDEDILFSCDWSVTV